MGMRRKAVWAKSAQGFTDGDAQMFRYLLKKYSVATILKELTRIVSAYSEQADSWVPVRKALRRAVLVRASQQAH